MKELKWSALKSERLKKTRGMSFEDIFKYRVITTKNHPTIAGQKIMLFEVNGYVWLAPCVATDEEIFLKTLYPSRKYTRLFKKGVL